MRIKKAKALGFCFGVRRAIQMVERAAAVHGPIDSLGSVVHNPQVVERLAAKSIQVGRISENEPMLLGDMEEFLERVAPAHARYNHNDFAHNARNGGDGEEPNGHSHYQQLLLGAREAVPIVDGRLLLGHWQRLFLVELDRPREREVVVQLVGE